MTVHRHGWRGDGLMGGHIGLRNGSHGLSRLQCTSRNAVAAIPKRKEGERWKKNLLREVVIDNLKSAKLFS